MRLCAGPSNMVVMEQQQVARQTSIDSPSPPAAEIVAGSGEGGAIRVETSSGAGAPAVPSRAGMNEQEHEPPPRNYNDKVMTPVPVVRGASGGAVFATKDEDNEFHLLATLRRHWANLNAARINTMAVCMEHAAMNDKKFDTDSRSGMNLDENIKRVIFRFLPERYTGAISCASLKQIVFQKKTDEAAWCAQTKNRKAPRCSKAEQAWVEEQVAFITGDLTERALLTTSRGNYFSRRKMKNIVVNTEVPAVPSNYCRVRAEVVADTDDVDDEFPFCYLTHSHYIDFWERRARGNAHYEKQFVFSRPIVPGEFNGNDWPSTACSKRTETIVRSRGAFTRMPPPPLPWQSHSQQARTEKVRVVARLLEEGYLVGYCPVVEMPTAILFDQPTGRGDLTTTPTAFTELGWANLSRLEAGDTLGKNDKLFGSDADAQKQNRKQPLTTDQWEIRVRVPRSMK